MYRAFRDSSYLYEQIKPIVSKLRIAYDYKSKESEELRLSNQALRLDRDLQETLVVKLQTKAQKRTTFQKWIGRGEGFGIGLAVGIIISTLL